MRFTYMRAKLVWNGIVTDNNNRIRDEVIAAMTKLMAGHESNAFGRLDTLEKSHTALRANIEDIFNILADIRKEKALHDK